LAPPSVRPLLPTDSDPSVHNQPATSGRVVPPPAVPAGARTHTAPARHQVSARVRVRASVRVIRLARPLCSLPSGTPLVPTPAGRRTLRHIVSSHVRQDAIVVDLAVDFALADELVSLSG
jgi:hypothetical protein